MGATLRAAGPVAALALLPFGLQVLLECGSWRVLLAKLGQAVSWGVAVRANLGAEAVRLSLPAGAAVAEGLRPVLFARHGGVTMSHALSAVAVRKLCHLGTQGAYLALGAAMGGALFARWAVGLGGAGSGLLVAAWVLAAAMMLLAAFLGASLLHGSLAVRAERLLTRLTGGRLAWLLEERRSGFAALDGRLRLLLGGGGVLVWNLVTAMGGWLCDAAETWLILSVLGTRLGFGEAIAFEAVISVVRPFASIVPGGLGIQDLGYHALLGGVFGDAVSMSFIVLKRARDLFWALAGFCFQPL